MAKLIAIGKTVKLHGFKGALVVFTDSGKESALASLQRIWLGHTPEDVTEYALLSAQWMPKGWKLELKNISTETAAQALLGLSVFAERQDLPEPENNEYYLSDLLGVPAFELETQNSVGTFKALLETGQTAQVKATSWVFQTPSGELCVPAVAHFIHSVNLQEKKIWLKNLQELP
ncbi:16S rRNA processing protein RimM [bacterium]|nr:16S rRNA processing protein RimM [bacterium]